MDRELLRRVQMEQLEIAKEIKRVCDENHIPYFLNFGTLLGAVRHKGFIPWDDDMDMGMLRSAYERFLEIAPEKMKPEYFVQTWYSDPQYPFPYAKVRKRGTVYLENKSARLKENGFFVDIFPYDNLPADDREREHAKKKLHDLFRTKLMKAGFQPWAEDGRINWKKRVGYLYYQVKALGSDSEELAQRFDGITKSFPENAYLFWQEGISQMRKVNREWCEELIEMEFEGERFKCPKGYDALLRARYGDYMQLPPENKRENRHQIVQIDFGV